MDEKAGKWDALREYIERERRVQMRTHSKEEHEPNDKSFTVELTANDPFYADKGEDAKHSKHDCGGYLVFLFTDEGSLTIAQGMSNIMMLIDGLLNLYSPAKVRKALAVVTAKKMLSGELSIEQMTELFSNKDEDGDK